MQQAENSSTFTQQNLYMLLVLPAQGKLVLQHSYVIPMYGVIPALFYPIRSPHSRDRPVGNLICCKTGLNGAGITRNITFCSSDSKQVARYCCPYYRSSRRNWLVQDCIFWWFKSSLLAMGRPASSHKLQIKPFILHTLRICTLRALKAYSKVLD